MIGASTDCRQFFPDYMYLAQGSSWIKYCLKSLSFSSSQRGKRQVGRMNQLTYNW